MNPSSIETRRRPRPLSIVLMIATNALLLLCLVGLGVVALGERFAFSKGQTTQQVVKAYLDSRVPEFRYRICRWYEPEPLPAGVAGNAEDGAVAQRVKIVFYGPQGAKQIDTVYVVKGGEVQRLMEPEHPDFARNL